MLFRNKKIRIATFFLVVLGLTSCSSTRELVVLHTNDTHSQVEVNTSRDYQNKGGYVRRAAFIDSVRRATKAVLLVDAGDYVQGTPYFNFFKGEVEAKAIRQMKYDAVMLGNHEFDNGIEALVSILKTMKTPVVCSNYDVSRTPLAPYVKPYLTMKKQGVKIGIIGIGVHPQSLISPQNFSGIIYLDPIETANRYARFLKEEKHCDFVLCLTHLGTKSVFGMSDPVLAAQTSNIDLIVGGHSHELIDNLQVPNLQEKNVLIVQAGKTGAYIGEVDIIFNKQNN
jgi:5'-nucleotidase